ncbi:MAG: hypothetical protein IH898_07915, partial [Planctomycetes bacterium]|nr:hypothetical protein [Planctomycetota bacterium]
MKTSYRAAALMTSFSLLLAISVATSDCSAFGINFTGDCDPNVAAGFPRACNPFGQLVHDQESNDFNDPNNWWFGGAIGGLFPSEIDTFEIQDFRTAVFSSDPNNGSTTLGGLVVSDSSFGRLRMTGGSLTLLNQVEQLEIGRERNQDSLQGDYNKNGVADAADSTVWQDTLGQEVLNSGDGADGDESGFVDAGDYDYWADRFGLITRGGELIMTGSSTITTNGAAVGRRSKGVLTVGPDAVLNVWGPETFGSSDIVSDGLEVGIYGPVYITGTLPGGGGGEPGFAADGLMIVEGTVNADALRIQVFGGKGEFRLLPGGSVNLNGALTLSHCD